MSEIETLPARDGTPLLTRRRDPPGYPDAWATLLLVPGIGEHSGRCEAVDPIVPPASTAALGGLAGAERQLLPNVRHEPHNDPDDPPIVDAAVAWLREQPVVADRLD